MVLGGTLAIPAAVVFFGVAGATAIAANGSFDLGIVAMGTVLGEIERQGKLDDAVEKLNTTLKINPFYAEAHCNLGITFQDMGKANLARSSFTRAVEISPGMAEAHNGLAEVSIDQGQLKDAMLSVKQALKINPDYSEAQNPLGIVLNKKGKTDSFFGC